jgi:N-acetylglutamate synthase-like GNAT family acetyltransferase
MSPPKLSVRRATTDDFQNLRSLWSSARLPTEELEARLTEFQLVESADGQLVGAIGIQIAKQHARLHSEAYTDANLADEARQLLWERIQLIASHHGVFRLWTQDNSPFWSRCGFRIVITESLVQLPEEWKRFEGKWYWLQLKNEVALATLEKELASFRKSGEQQTAQTLSQARVLRAIIIVIGFTIGIAGICWAGYLLFRAPFFSHAP